MQVPEKNKHYGVVALLAAPVEPVVGPGAPLVVQYEVKYRWGRGQQEGGGGSLGQGRQGQLLTWQKREPELWPGLLGWEPDTLGRYIALGAGGARPRRGTCAGGQCASHVTTLFLLWPPSARPFTLSEGVTCGGAYLKLLSADSALAPEGLVDSTPYSIMFGPDKCGGPGKVRPRAGGDVGLSRGEGPASSTMVAGGSRLCTYSVLRFQSLAALSILLPFLHPLYAASLHRNSRFTSSCAPATPATAPSLSATWPHRPCPTPPTIPTPTRSRSGVRCGREGRGRRAQALGCSFSHVVVEELWGQRSGGVGAGRGDVPESRGHVCMLEVCSNSKRARLEHAWPAHLHSPDHKYEISIDGEVKSSGDLLAEGVVAPPLRPPREVPDPEDTKPADWVDLAV